MVRNIECPSIAGNDEDSLASHTPQSQGEKGSGDYAYRHRVVLVEFNNYKTRHGRAQTMHSTAM